MMGFRYFALPIALGCLLAWGSTSAAAAVSDEEFARLQAQIAALADRVNTLETENASLKASNEQTIKEVELSRQQFASVGERQSAANWTDTISWKGDFRYRVENIDEEGRDDRDRNRIRARTLLTAQLPQDVEIGLGLASGGEDPVSTNQTLGGGGSSKDIRLDLAYANWNAMEGLNIVAGKFKNVWYRPMKSSLIFDGDFNPEGFGATYKAGSFFANFAGTWLESDSRGGNDEFAWGGQVGFKGKLAGIGLAAGASYYDFETGDQQVFFGDDDDFFGNSFSCADPADLETCTYDYDYKMINGFAEASMSVADMPLALFVDYVVNDDADDEDTGYRAGFKLGKAGASGTWEVSYAYQDLEADAVFALITDSDFGGGGTDAEGHIIGAAYGINKKWKVGFTYFVNEVDEAAGNKHDYDRLMIDTQFKY
jgi:hypothetical protein